MTERYGDGAMFSPRDPAERRRLGALTGLDSHALRRVDSLNPQPDWRCIDIGSGLGSVATLIAARCPQGEVIAADKDTRFLHDADLPGNVTILDCDIETQTFDPNSFDLIHARFLLEHLPTRKQVLDNFVTWLKPGGWLVVEDVNFDRVAQSSDPIFGKVMLGAAHAAHMLVGTDFGWAVNSPTHLAEAGLIDVATEHTIMSAGPGDTFDDAYLISAEQATPWLAQFGVTEDELAAFPAAVRGATDPDMGALTVAAWGQKPRS